MIRRVYQAWGASWRCLMMVSEQNLASECDSRVAAGVIFEQAQEPLLKEAAEAPLPVDDQPSEVCTLPDPEMVYLLLVIDTEGKSPGGVRENK